MNKVSLFDLVLTRGSLQLKPGQATTRREKIQLADKNCIKTKRHAGDEWSRACDGGGENRCPEAVGPGEAGWMPLRCPHLCAPLASQDGGLGSEPLPENLGSGNL